MIPTAQEMLDTWKAKVSVHFRRMADDLKYRNKYENERVDILEKECIDWCKLHVQAALEIASQNAEIDGPTHDWLGHQTHSIDKNSILNSYPLDNIK
jgi:hypothetical protein